MKRKIYLASSWRNEGQPEVVKMLRNVGHEVYDFRNPTVGNRGFQWSEIHPNWKNWTLQEYVKAITHPIAKLGFSFDWKAMQWADMGVLLLPCGRSAHLEAGYFSGAKKKLVIVLNGNQFEPELMYKMADAVCCEMFEALEAIESLE